VTAEVQVRVIPRAGRSQVAGRRDGALLIRLAAPPVDGAANDELVALLSRLLDIPKRSIAIVSGERARTKRVRIEGLSLDDVHRRLEV
jgi:uncharacterized protein (TIGR00251 family)